MNKPHKASEPSMDEILASIRKIIAEEPSDARGDGEGVSNPLLTGTELRSERSEKPFSLNDRPRPSLDRLSSAIKARATAPPPAPPPASFTRPSPFGIEPPASFDDLADLLDEPPAPHKLAESLPRLELQPRTDDAIPTAVSAPAISEAEADAIDEAISALPEDAGTAPPLSEALAPSEPLQAASESALSVPPAPAVPPAVSPWDSMRRKNGFWPPQATASSKPAPSPSAAADASASAPLNGSYLPGSGPFPSKEAQQSQSIFAPPSATADLVARLHAGLSEPPVAPEPASPPQMQFGVPLGAGIPSAASPAVNGATNGVGYPAPPAGPSNFVPPFPAARPAEPAPPPPQPQAPEPYARPLSADAVMNAALAQLISGGTPPAAPDPFARPHAAPDTGDRYHPGPYAQNNSYAQNSYNQNPYAQNPYPQSYAPAEADPATAAFDALAHGLGRSPRPEPQRAYDYHTPAASPAPTALVAQPLLPAVQDYHPQAVRTLEDAVAEMLKPLLQKWLSDNMPRIIERALRVEAASGMKPPGSQ